MVLQVAEPGGVSTTADLAAPVAPPIAASDPTVVPPAAVADPAATPRGEAADPAAALPTAVVGEGTAPAPADGERRPRRALVVAAALVLLAGAVGTAFGPWGEADSLEPATVEETPGTDLGAGRSIASPSTPSTDGTTTVSRSGLPVGTDIYVSGEDLTERLVSDSIALPAGTYRLRAEAAGYLPDALQIDLAAGVGRSWTPVLEVVPVAPVAVDPTPDTVPTVEGLVRILGELPSDAEVVVSGATMDDLTLAADSIALPPGTYRIRASAPGYSADELELDLVSGTTRTWTPSLQLDPVVPGPEVTAPDPAPRPEEPVIDLVSRHSSNVG